MTTAVIIVGLGILALFFFRGSGGAAIIEHVSPAEAKTMLQDSNTIALDVRTPGEIKAGKISGALELNVTSLDFVKGLEKLDKEKTYIVYCRSGSRSMRASRVMASNGFEHVYNMSGGFLAWR